MDVSKRIEFIIENLDKVNTIADIGTDHGYVPLVALRRGICTKAIACDINKDPLNKARLNAILEVMGYELEFRLGDGLSPLKDKEVEEVVIAGMGGNLIRDILENDISKVEDCEVLVLQPAQNPEVLREYLYKNNYEILKEDLCCDDGIYYELFKVKRAEGHATELDSIYYEISPILLRQKHPLIKEYLEFKVKDYSKILSFITEATVSANARRKEIENKITIIKSMLNYL
jgi:tRNA (adenine22-N1)-methyltransferase